ncbi:MAG: hypothetical protein PGN22_02340 [Agrobacterium cavarae]
MADHDHYLAGPCEGMSLHRIGREVQFKDTSGREPESKRVFEDEERASAFIWRHRQELYAKYDQVAA